MTLALRVPLSCVVAMLLLVPGSARASLWIGLSAEAEAAQARDEFQVRLRWQTPSSEAEFEIVRSRLDGSEERPLTIPWQMGVPGFGPGPGRDQVHVDAEVLPVTAYRYTVRPVHDAEGQLEAVEVEIPGNEVEILGRQRLAELDLTSRPIHRLILRQGAELVTEGQDLKAQLIELVAENAVILTFPEGSTAPLGQTGRSGGSISIHAHRGSGKLTLFGRGEKGGEGQQGDQGAQGKPGKPGQKSRSSWGGKDGEPICVIPPGDGGPGYTGGTGLKGSRGFPGGSSASIEVSISEASALAIEVKLEPGKGGEGGAKGLGGKGGFGGRGGGISIACSEDVKDGLDGDTGLEGEKGEEGQSGRRLSCCVSIGGKTLENCEDCDEKPLSVRSDPEIRRF